jgi:DNA polymerase-3 subunit epsilon
MSRVLGLDLETTGLDVTKDRILEIGAIIYDTKEKVPLAMLSEMINPMELVPPEITPEYVSPTGLKGEHILEFGESICLTLRQIEAMIIRHKPVALVGHNIVGYDLPLLKHELERVRPMDCPNLLALPLIDTRHDLPFEKEPSSRRLSHLISDHGFLNPFPHRAVFDVMACLKLMSHYDFEEVLAQSKIPWVTMRAFVSYDDRQKAKDLRYSWEQAGAVKLPKAWIKAVRSNAVEREVAAGLAAGFRGDLV